MRLVPVRITPGGSFLENLRREKRKFGLTEKEVAEGIKWGKGLPNRKVAFSLAETSIFSK